MSSFSFLPFLHSSSSPAASSSTATTTNDSSSFHAIPQCSSSASASSSPPPPLCCPLCTIPSDFQIQQQQQHFAHDLALEAHLANDHFQLRPFKCPICMQLPNHSGADAIVAFATEWAFLDHLAYAHNQYGGNCLLEVDLELVSKRRQIQRLITCAILARESARIIGAGGTEQQPTTNGDMNIGIGHGMDMGGQQRVEIPIATGRPTSMDQQQAGAWENNMHRMGENGTGMTASPAAAGSLLLTIKQEPIENDEGHLDVQQQQQSCHSLSLSSASSSQSETNNNNQQGISPLREEQKAADNVNTQAMRGKNNQGQQQHWAVWEQQHEEKENPLLMDEGQQPSLQGVPPTKVTTEMMDEIEAAKLLRSAAFKLSQSLLMHRKEKEQMQREKQQLEMATTANGTDENNEHIHEQQEANQNHHIPMEEDGIETYEQQQQPLIAIPHMAQQSCSSEEEEHHHKQQNQMEELMEEEEEEVQVLMMTTARKRPAREDGRMPRRNGTTKKSTNKMKRMATMKSSIKKMRAKQQEKRQRNGAKTAAANGAGGGISKEEEQEIHQFVALLLRKEEEKRMTLGGGGGSDCANKQKKKGGGGRPKKGIF